MVVKFQHFDVDDVDLREGVVFGKKLVGIIMVVEIILAWARLIRIWSRRRRFWRRRWPFTSKARGC